MKPVMRSLWIAFVLAASVVGAWLASAGAAAPRAHEPDAPSAERTPEQWIAAACDVARERGIDVLLWIRREAMSEEQRERDEAFVREILEPNQRDEFVVLEAPVAVGAPAAELPGALRAIGRWMPVGSRTGPVPAGGSAAPLPARVDFARTGLYHDLTLLDDRGRPFAVLGSYEPGARAGFLDQVREARTVRAARDRALARAASAIDGAARAAALRDALAPLDRWLVVRCHGDELAEAARLGDDAVRAWAAPLVHEHRVVLGCDAVGTVCAGQLGSIDARRLRRELAAATAAFRDVPEVMQLAACCEGTVDLRLALDAADRAAIAGRLEAALDLAPQSWSAGFVRAQLHDLER